MAQEFVNCANDNNINLFDNIVTHYLDITLLGIPGRVSQCPYRKPRARNSMLLATSYHPPHVIHNIPHRELIRAKRKSTTITTFSEHQKEVSGSLKARKFPQLDNK